MLVVANLRKRSFFSELESASLPNPHSTASKKFRLLFKDGTIVLRPLQFGQVRGREERSDEQKRCVHGIPVLIAATSVRIVAAIFATIFNAINTPSFANHFARRRRRSRSWPRWRSVRSGRTLLLRRQRAHSVGLPPALLGQRPSPALLAPSPALLVAGALR